MARPKTADPDDVDALLKAADRLPYGPARVEVCERAVAVADSRHDPAAAFAARLELVEAAVFGGRPDVMLVAYAWLLAQFDADRGRFAESEHTLLWWYKGVAAAAAGFPDVSVAEIDGLLADMARRFQAYGSTRHPALNVERAVALSLGDMPRARAAHAKLGRSGRSSLSHCAACVANGTVGYWAALGNPAKAVAAADPILAGRLTCENVPKKTYAALLDPCRRLGRFDDAARHHRAGWPLVATGPTDDSRADHVEFLTLTGNITRATTLAAKHLAGADAAHSPATRRTCLSAYRLLFAALTAAGAKPIRLTLPAGHALHTVAVDDLFPVEAVLAWIDAEVRALAGRFDARNGNSYYSDALAGQAETLAGATPFPVPARAPKDV